MEKLLSRSPLELDREREGEWLHLLSSDVQAVETGATIVVACAEDFGEISEAERAFQALGRALADAGLT